MHHTLRRALAQHPGSPSLVAVAAERSVTAVLPALLLDDAARHRAGRVLAMGRPVPLPDAPSLKWLIIPTATSDQAGAFLAEATHLRAFQGGTVRVVPPIVSWSLQSGNRRVGAARPDWPFTPVVGITIDRRIYAIDEQECARASVAASDEDVFGSFLRRGLYLTDTIERVDETATYAGVLAEVSAVFQRAEPAIDAYLALFGAVPQLGPGATHFDAYIEALSFELLRNGFLPPEVLDPVGARAHRIGRVRRVKKNVVGLAHAVQAAAGRVQLPAAAPTMWDAVFDGVPRGRLIGVRAMNDEIDARPDVVYADGDAGFVVWEALEGEYEALVFGDGGIALRAVADGRIELIGDLLTFEGAEQIVEALFARDDGQLAAAIRQHGSRQSKAAISLLLRALFSEKAIEAGWAQGAVRFVDETTFPQPSRYQRHTVCLRNTDEARRWLESLGAIPGVDFVELDDSTIGVRASAFVPDIAEHGAAALAAYVTTLPESFRPEKGPAIVPAATPWLRHDPIAPLHADVLARVDVFLRTGAGYDDSREAPSVESQKKRDQRARKTVRLKVLGRSEIPCVAASIARVREGMSVGTSSTAKAVAEYTQAFGFKPAQVARRLRLDLEESAARDLSWLASNALGGLSLARGTASGECGCQETRSNGDDCRELACYRYADVVVAPGWPWGASNAPSFNQYQLQARVSLARELRVTRQPPVRAIEAPMRSGKTYSVTQRAVDEAAAGKVTVIAFPAHGQIEPAERYAKGMLARAPSSSKVVHLLGIERACILPKDESRPKCSDCLHGPTAKYQGPALVSPGTDNRDAVRALVVEPGVYDEQRLRDTGAHYGMCPRTVSVSLVDDAKIVLCTHAHLLDEGARGLLPLVADRVVVDEADQLIESLVERATTVLPIAVTRTKAEVPFHRDQTCQLSCEGCSFQFGNAATTSKRATDVLSLPIHLNRADEFADPVWAPDAFDRGLQVLRTFAPNSSRIDLTKVKENIDLFRRALLDPRQHRVQVPGRYGRTASRRATPHDVFGKLIDDHVQAAADPRLLGVGSSAVVIRFEPCLLPDSFPVKPARSVPGVFVGPTSSFRVATSLREIGIETSKVPAHDRQELDMIWKFIALTHSSSAGDITGLLYRRRAERVANTPPCGIDLFRVAVSEIESLRRYLTGATYGTDLVSGTIPRPDLMRRMLWLSEKDFEHVVVRSPVHGGFAHYLEGPAVYHRDGQAYKPMYGAQDAHAAIMEFIRAWRHEGHEAPRVLVFAGSKRSADEIADSFSNDSAIRVAKHGPDDTVTVAGRFDRDPSVRIDGRVDISYLRSVESRGIDFFANLVVVVGYGYPGFATFHAFATALSVQAQPVAPSPSPTATATSAMEEQSVTVLALAEASRTAAANQAMARSVGKDARTVVWTFNRATLDTVGEDFRARTVLGSAIQLSGADSYSRVTRLVAESIRFLLGQRSLPAGPWLDATRAGGLHILLLTRAARDQEREALARRKQEVIEHLRDAKVQNPQRVLEWVLERIRTNQPVRARDYSNSGAIKTAIRWLKANKYVVPANRGEYEPTQRLKALIESTPDFVGWPELVPYFEETVAQLRSAANDATPAPAAGPLPGWAWATRGLVASTVVHAPRAAVGFAAKETYADVQACAVASLGAIGLKNVSRAL